MTKTDALLYAREKIRVNSVHPGYIRTPMVQELGRDSPDGVDAFRRELDSKHPIGRRRTGRHRLRHRLSRLR
jgi:NAD(P)-dependent dehydrogenase (short-subunit alcohol dehydrogenase family)